MNPFNLIGVRGVLGVIALAAAWQWLARARGPRRSLLLFRAWVGALAGVIFATLAWRQIATIQVDRAEEIAAARAVRQENEDRQTRTLADRAKSVRFAEDSHADTLDLAGQKAVSQLDEYERAALSAEDAAGGPAYLQGGRQTREAGRRRTDAPKGLDALSEGKPVGVWRTMPEADFWRATRLGRLLLAWGRLTLLVTALLALADYLRRLNTTHNAFFPLPLASRGLDRLAPAKRLLLRVRPPDDAATLPNFLEDTIRKGESFIYLGPRRLLESAVRHRFQYGAWRWLAQRCYACPDRQPWYDPEFVFEVAWFGRGSFQVEGLDAAASILAEIGDRLARRHLSRAQASRAVTVIWNHPEAPPADVWDDLEFYGPEANLRIVRCDRMAPDAWPAPAPAPALLEHFLREGPGPSARWVVRVAVRGGRAMLALPGRVGRGMAAWARNRQARRVTARRVKVRPPETTTESAPAVTSAVTSAVTPAAVAVPVTMPPTPGHMPTSAPLPTPEPATPAAERKQEQAARLAETQRHKEAQARERRDAQRLKIQQQLAARKQQATTPKSAPGEAITAGDAVPALSGTTTVAKPEAEGTLKADAKPIMPTDEKSDAKPDPNPDPNAGENHGLTPPAAPDKDAPMKTFNPPRPLAAAQAPKLPVAESVKHPVHSAHGPGKPPLKIVKHAEAPPPEPEKPAVKLVFHRKGDAPAASVAKPAAPPPAPASPAPSAPASPAVPDPIFKFRCPQCGQKLEGHASWVGRRFDCPACLQVVDVPPPVIWVPGVEVKFLCAGCGRKIAVPINMTGTAIECPGCGTQQQAPAM